MVIDCLHEDLQLEKSMLAELNKHLRNDCILATNSSSFRAELVADAVPNRPKAGNQYALFHPTQKPHVRSYVHDAQ